MKFTAAQIAGILEGEVVGNPDAEVFKLSKIEEGTEGSLTFLANPKYINYIYSTQASVTIVNNTFEPEQEITTTLIKVEDAYKSFSKLLEYYNQVKLMKSGIEQPSVISDGVTYGSDLYLGSFCYVGKNVIIGNNVKIYPNSFIGDNVTIGDNCVFFAGVRIYSETVIGNTASETVKGETETYEPPVDPDAKGTEPVEPPKPAEDEIFTAVEQQAEFPGGAGAWGRFLQKTLKYPSAAQRANVGGRVFVSFVVNTDGTVQDVQVLKGVGFGCDEEAIRVIKSMPRWNPGKQSGRAVRSRFTQPITFVLSE